MPNRIAATFLIGLFSLAGLAHCGQPAAPTSAPATQPAQPIDPIGDAALAERFTQMAQATLSFRALNETTFKEAAALLKGACSLDPGDPRFPRLLSEACLQLGDREGAIDALQLVTAADPNDQVALIQLLDLYAAKMQSADAKLRYFNDKLAITALPAPVRAHIAYRAAQQMLDRGQDAEVKDMVAQSLKLNPLDPDALELNEKISRNGKPEDHIAALLSLLLANPAQPAVMSGLASELADQGLTSESAGWYANCVSVNNRLNAAPDAQTYADYIAEVIIAGQAKGAGTIADSLLQADPTNVAGLYLKLLVTRRGDDADATAKAMDQATSGFCERVYDAYRLATKSDPPATQPSGDLNSRLGDITILVKQVTGSKNPVAIAHLGSAITDLAWLQIYFANKPGDAAPLVTALHSLLPADDVRFGRLEGWALLMQKKPDEAKVKLSALADRDPLSAMGVIRILSAQPAQKDALARQAKQLVDANPAGLLGVMLLDGLHDQGVSGVDITDAGNTIKTSLSRFPKQIFDILDSPDKFYQISCEPTRVPHAYDDPMMAVVKITNLTPIGLTIGTKGIIHPDLWFDVQLRGLDQQNLAGVAYDRISDRTVLQAGESTEQLVRMDQPKLAQVLAKNPLIAIQLSFSVVTNPISSATGIGPGPAGQRQLMRRFVERVSSPLTPENQQQMQQMLASGSGDMKMRVISLVASFARAFLASNDSQVQAHGKSMVDVMSALANDPSPSVAAWAQYQGALARPVDQRPAILKQMVKSDYWAQRMLAASLAIGMTGQPAKEAFDTLAKDADPVVKRYAVAAAYDAAHPTTQPSATQPTSLTP